MDRGWCIWCRWKILCLLEYGLSCSDLIKKYGYISSAGVITIIYDK